MNLGHRYKFEIRLADAQSSSRSSEKAETRSFHVVVLQRTAKKCTKIYNARAQLLFCSLNFLFSKVPVAVAFMVFLNSLLVEGERSHHCAIPAPLKYDRYISFFPPCT